MTNREIRTLTGTEKWAVQPRLNGVPSHTIVSVAHIIGPIREITRHHVVQALLRTVQRFLYLRTLVRLDLNSFVEVAPTDLLSCVDEITHYHAADDNNIDWKSQLYEELESFCPGYSSPDTLPWRVYFLKSREDANAATVIHSVDHLIEDGRSTQIFFNEFLRNLSAETKSGTEPPTPPPPSPASFSVVEEAQSSQDRRTEPFSRFQLFWEVCKEIVRKVYATDLPARTPAIAPRDRHHVIECVCLSEETTQKVAAMARADGISVTSFLMATVLQSIKETFDPTVAKAYYTTLLGIDLRPFYRPDGSCKELLGGSHVEVRRESYTIRDDGRSTVRQVAQQFHADLRAFIQSRQPMRKPLDFERYLPSIDTLAVSATNGRTGMLHCASLGVWTQPDEQAFRVSEYYFAVPIKLIGPTIYFNLLTVNGRLNITFTFIDEIVPPPLRTKFLQTFRWYLDPPSA